MKDRLGISKGQASHWHHYPVKPVCKPLRGNIQWTVFSVHSSYAIRAKLQNKRTPKTISWCVPKNKGANNPTKITFSIDHLVPGTQIPPRLAGGLPRHEAPTPEMCTAAPAAFQVTTCRNGWMKEPKTGSFRTVSRWRMIKDTQLASFLRGKGNTPVLSCWRPWPCSTSWARFFHMVSKAGISRFLSISSSNSWAIANPPTSHLTLVPDFNACFYQIF